MNEGQEAVDYYFHYCPRIVINYSIDYVYILLVAFLFHAFDCYIDYFLLIMILNVFFNISYIITLITILIMIKLSILSIMMNCLIRFVIITLTGLLNIC